MKRTRYTEQQKRKIIAEAASLPRRDRGEVFERYGITSAQLCMWRKKYARGGSTITKAMSDSEADASERVTDTKTARALLETALVLIDQAIELQS